jgi:hypothetical protein
MGKRLAEVEKTLVTHDAALRDIYQRIKPLLLPAARSCAQEDRFLSLPFVISGSGHLYKKAPEQT